MDSEYGPNKKSEFETKGEYEFKDKKLELEALTHKSYCYENPMSGHHNERLEFLGDSIVGFLVARYLYKKFPEHTEGQLSMLRAKIVCKQSLARFAVQLGLDRKLRLGLGSMGSRNNEKILEDAFEAYIGAIFLDSNIDVVEKHIEKLIAPVIDQISKSSSTVPPPEPFPVHKGATGPIDLELPSTLEHQDPIGRLQTWSLKKGFPVPFYREVSVTGIAHEPIFTIDVHINGKPAGTGVGRNKKEAKKNAAIEAYKYLTSDTQSSNSKFPNSRFSANSPEVFTGPSN
ncbi:16370_t:CDS:1 [Acaulospora colombiana]|uniref:16370_t:CDS:1 n=1 Tax=Acaulospora colombiana TaxID=27376 RepID=A0ACA9M3N1_9GLOM|nr:16370_t:CDS:1 [Acaulospora colombiana]